MCQGGTCIIPFSQENDPLTDPLTSRHHGAQTSSCGLLLRVLPHVCCHRHTSACFCCHPCCCCFRRRPWLQMSDVELPCAWRSIRSRCCCSPCMGHIARPAQYRSRSGTHGVLSVEEHALTTLGAIAPKPMNTHCVDLAFLWTALRCSGASASATGCGKHADKHNVPQRAGAD